MESFKGDPLYESVLQNRFSYPVKKQVLDYEVSDDFRERFRVWAMEKHRLPDEVVEYLLEPPIIRVDEELEDREDFLFDIQGNDVKWYSPFSIEILWSRFVELDPEDDEEILTFVNEFGRVGNEFLPYPNTYFEPVDSIREQIYSVRRILELFVAFRDREYEKVVMKLDNGQPYILFYDKDGYLSLSERREYLKTLSKPVARTIDLPKGCGGWLQFWNELNESGEKEDFYKAFVSYTLARRMDDFLAMVHPGLTYKDGRIEPALHSSCLLGVIYHQLYMIITGTWGLRRCADENCGRYFVPKRRDQVFCSTECGGRKRSRESYRRKNKPCES